MDKIRGIPETMLQTLYARAEETKKGRGFINDEKAVEIVSSLNYDFKNAEKDKAMKTGVVARTILLDKMTEDFLLKNPGAVVVNIACGLDTRCYRMKGKYLRWYNLDLPETMEIRNRFLKETDPVFTISSSAMDEKWKDSIDFSNEPVLIIIEGLTMYLDEKSVQKIFGIISDKFPEAAVFVEVMNPRVASHIKEKSIEGSSAKFTWGIKNGKELQKLLPQFKFSEEKSLTEGMQVFMPVYKILGKIGFVRNISNKIIVMEKIKTKSL